MNDLKEIIRSGNATIVDVRSYGEFQGGHVADSINIPLRELPNRLPELHQMRNIVLCCASGGRSRRAYEYLMENGINCLDAGPWVNVNNIRYN